MQMVSFMPQLHPQIGNQSISTQQVHNVAALPMLQKSEHYVAEDQAQKSFGVLSGYKQNGTQPFSNDAVAATTIVGGGETNNKRSQIEPGLKFTSKRFKPSHAVSTTSGSSEPSSSDGGFDSVHSSYENSSKQASNNSDSSETD